MSTAFTISVPAMFNGPPGSANGGISAGLAASQIDGPAEVSLRAPPPLTATRMLLESLGYAEAEPGWLSKEVPA